MRFKEADPYPNNVQCFSQIRKPPCFALSCFTIRIGPDKDPMHPDFRNIYIQVSHHTACGNFVSSVKVQSICFLMIFDWLD